MRSKHAHWLVASVLTASIVVACSSDKDKRDASNGAAGRDDAGGSEAGPTDNDGGVPGGTAAPGAGGDPGGSVTVGAAVGGDAGAGDMGGGGAGSVSPQNLGVLQGPELDDQTPITIDVAHSGFYIDPLSPVLVDPDGNVFVRGGGAMHKYGPTLAPLWSYAVHDIAAANATKAQIFSPTWSLAADGGVFFGGNVSAALPGEAFGGGTDAVVGKISAGGMLAWLHQLGASSGETTVATAATADGGVIAMGSSGGQLPGSAIGMSTGPWVARFAADGSRTFLKQYVPPATDSPKQLLVESSGNIDLIEGSSILRVDAAGAELSRATLLKQLPGGGLDPTRFTTYPLLASSPTHDEFYTLAAFNSTGAVTSLGKYGHELDLEWYRGAEPARTAVIDAVENVIWHGNLLFTGGAGFKNPLLVVGTDAVYVAGGYMNSYEHGAVARPLTLPFIVGRYDLKQGGRVWFQEFLFKAAVPQTPATGGMALDPDGNLVIAVQGASPTSGFLFRVKAADGTPL